MYDSWDSELRAQQTAQNANARALEIKYTAEELSKRVEKLSLLCQAMWELLRQRAEFTDQMLAAKVLEVDLRDGRQDNRIGESVFDCPHCQSPVNSRSPRCVMCGKLVPTPHPFEV